MTEIEDIPAELALVKTKAVDLSTAIAKSVERRAGQTVRCSRVYGDHYRCNWWSNGGHDALGSAIGRIVRSRFFRATMTADGLMLEDVTR